MGSTLQTKTLDLTRDWLGHENISEVLNFSRPEVIQQIHESFLEVGCDAVETNTFGANKIVLAEADMSDRVFENNRVAAEIARRACEKFETPDAPKYVIGSIGPGTKLITLGQTTWDVMLDSYREQVRGLLAGGVDVLPDRNSAGHAGDQCCIAAANSAMPKRAARADHGAGVVRHQQRQQMLTGLGSDGAVGDLHAVRRGRKASALNCALGPSTAESARYIAETWPRCQPRCQRRLPIMVDGAAISR
jgi:5-methyltetrahydrofolate--homocysteine methyltransferase